MKFRSVMQAGELRGKRILVRLDFNVPFNQGRPLDFGLFKIERSLATVKALHARGAKVILATHLGRPEGKRASELSTRPLAPVLSTLLGAKVFATSEITGMKALSLAKKMKNRDVLLLENLRYEKGEEENDSKFAKELATLADLYVNDAFAVSHRVHASVVGIAKHLPSYAGLELIREAHSLLRAVDAKPRDTLVVVGGAKASTKLNVIERFLSQGSRVALGGAVAADFFHAMGFEVGNSRTEKDIMIPHRILKSSRLLLPADVVLSKDVLDASEIRIAPPSNIGRREAIADIGLAAFAELSRAIEKVKIVVWNGPLGVVETPAFSYGSIMFGRLLAKQTELGCFSVVGGGDTLPIVHATGMERAFSHISVGGGAMLEFLSGKMLPGLVPLVL